VVRTTKLLDDSGRSPPAGISHSEAKLGLEARIIPNHEREFPDVMSMALPNFAETSLMEFLTRSTGRRVVSVQEGELLGSVEIPCIEEVVIDVWRTEGWLWATTTVMDVKFAVLERVCITCDFSHGSSHVSSIDLFARHPVSGHILEENIMRVPAEGLSGL